MQTERVPPPKSRPNMMAQTAQALWSTMLAVRIDSNLVNVREFKKYVTNVLFSKNINKTDLPCAWCYVCFCLCAFGAILKCFRRLLIFHVEP